ncbi:MAG: helix-turn-helix domain-containing protein [Pseudomonadales bacterium]
MTENNLQRLGDHITRLRIAKNLKQSELAFEAGISERTLQRMEAGEAVKSDGLLKVIAYLGKLEELLGVIDTPDLSPYELASRPGKESKQSRQRVRSSKNSKPSSNIQWPEDQT